MKVPWTARRSNLLILREINPEYSLEGLLIKLKLQYFAHLMGRANSLEKTLMLGKTEGMKKRGRQMISWLGGITDSKDMNLSKLQEAVMGRKPGHAAVHVAAESEIQLSDLATTKTTKILFQETKKETKE